MTNTLSSYSSREPGRVAISVIHVIGLLSRRWKWLFATVLTASSRSALRKSRANGRGTSCMSVASVTSSGDGQNGDATVGRSEMHLLRKRFRPRNRHHLIPRSRGGSRSPRNLLYIDQELHVRWHAVFKNKTLDEVIALLERVRRAKSRQRVA